MQLKNNQDIDKFSLIFCEKKLLETIGKMYHYCKFEAKGITNNVPYF